MLFFLACLFGIGSSLTFYNDREHFARRFEESDVLRTFLHAHGYTDKGFTDKMGRFLSQHETDSVTSVCNDIMNHVSGTHKGSMLHYILSSESEGDVMESVVAETVNYLANKLSDRRRLAEEQYWNITRRMVSDTWSQSLGYVVAGKALISDTQVDSGAIAFLSSFGNAEEQREGCAKFVNLVNDEVQESAPEGIKYDPEDQVVSITENFASSLGISKYLLPVTLTSGQIVLALFHSCRRFANKFGDATCLA